MLIKTILKIDSTAERKHLTFEQHLLSHSMRTPFRYAVRGIS
jgi:hypothetical protein